MNFLVNSISHIYEYMKIPYIMGDIYTSISSVSLEKPDWYTHQSLGTMIPICIRCKMKQDLVWATCSWIRVWLVELGFEARDSRHSTWNIQKHISLQLNEKLATVMDSGQSNWYVWRSLYWALCLILLDSWYGFLQRSRYWSPREATACFSTCMWNGQRWWKWQNCFRAIRHNEWCAVARRNNSHLSSLLRWYHW